MLYLILLLLASFRIGNAEEDNAPCVAQFDTNLKCVLELVASDDAKLIENKTKTVFHTTCAPSYPLDCFLEFEAAKQCYVDIKDLLDSPGPLKRQKDAANAAADACFGKKPSYSFLSGLEEIFLPSPVKVISGNLGQALWGNGGKNPIPVPPAAAAIMRGLGIGSTPPPSSTPAPAESGDNSTGDGSGSGDDDSSKLFGRPECAPKRKQFLCTFQELNKMSTTDSDLKSATEALKQGAEKCKKLLQEKCTPSTSAENQCVSDAHIPLILAFVDNILACMKDKGFTLPPMKFPSFSKSSPPPRLFGKKEKGD